MSSTPHSGLTLDARKQRTCNIAIVSAPIPDILVLPLNQHSDSELLPCVSSGDTVRAGQIIAEPEASLGAYLHSPVSGRVIAVEPRACTRSSSSALSIVIANDHLDTRDASAQPHTAWQSLESLALCELLAQGGIVGLGGAVFPAATKLSAHTQHDIEYLLINGVECEPYITCDDRLMRERAEQILQGIEILMRAAQARRCIIAIESDKPQALRELHKALDARIASHSAAAASVAATPAQLDIQLQTVPAAYPAGEEAQLITRLLNREVPRNALPAQIGVIVHNVATAYACARWIHQGEPLISRIVTITGSQVSKPANLEVRIGTDIASLLDHCTTSIHANSVLIMGGAMMGKPLASSALPVTKASNCLVVEPLAVVGDRDAELPCIRCGECAAACPVNLQPQQLLWHINSDNQLALEQLGLRDCIECGSCDVACPSHITLAQRFHHAKRA